ncbi:CASP-like protein 4A3 isoform X1 [Ziziphus jujuba]|uniref:CASP-like protein n=1 Tax=Ziziphus jujuba TaxID=326968 RepID=A0ABM4A0Z7_ZIZJJ|nr:CASP-like protein 4A3 isoform X1 [Ziziphus jujuba]
MNKSASKNSESSAHSRHSSLSPHNYHSPLRSEAGDPHEATPYASPENSPQKTVDNSRAIVTTNATNTEKYTQYSPLRPNMQDNNNNNNNNSNNYNNYRKTVENASAMPEKSPSPVVVLNRSTSMELPSSVTKVGPATSVIGGGDGGGGGGRSRYQQGRRPQNEDVMKSAALGFRVSEFVLCLISFSVMAADKTQGWSGDSFDRYKEYRYCLSVNVIACVYSAFQAYDLVYHLVYGKHLIRHHLRHHFEFSLDQAAQKGFGGVLEEETESVIAPCFSFTSACVIWFKTVYLIYLFLLKLKLFVNRCHVFIYGFESRLITCDLVGTLARHLIPIREHCCLIDICS